MRKAERSLLASEKAKALMDIDDYELLEEAIKEKIEVLFKYTDRHNKHSQYRREYPHSFFEIPVTEEKVEAESLELVEEEVVVEEQPEEKESEVYLWCEHKTHKKKEQYNIKRITDVYIIPDLIEAVMDVTEEEPFWAGTTSSEETTPL